VKSWVLTYTLSRGKSFVIGDKFQLTEVVPDKVTSSNLITYGKVTEIKPAFLNLKAMDSCSI